MVRKAKGVSEYSRKYIRTKPDHQRARNVQSDSEIFYRSIYENSMDATDLRTKDRTNTCQNRWKSPQ
jgi:hypothetical protein